MENGKIKCSNMESYYILIVRSDVLSSVFISEGEICLQTELGDTQIWNTQSSQHWQGNVGSDIETSYLWIWLHPTLYHWTAREYFLPGCSLSIQVQPDQGSNWWGRQWLTLTLSLSQGLFYGYLGVLSVTDIIWLFLNLTFRFIFKYLM